MSRGIEILMATHLPEIAQDNLRKTFSVTPVASQEELEAILRAAPNRFRGFAVDTSVAITSDVIDALPSVDIFANYGVGYDNIDAAHAATAGRMVSNTPDVLTEEVADTALGLLIMTVRELSAAERHLRAGKWLSEGAYRKTPGTLRGRSVGILGLGRIGKAVARRVEALGLPVSYWGRSRQDGVDYRYFASLEEMARACDTLISILPGGESTHRVIDETILKALGPDGVLINIGRGSSVDEAALGRALHDGTIFAAGLDVFENEPSVPEALLTAPNCVLLPHVGSASVATRNAMGMLVVDNLKSWFDTGRALTAVPECSAVSG